jgi:Ca-activated chloride channel family protein
MRFLAPWWLLLLIAVAALSAGYVVIQLRRRTYAVRFTQLALLRSVAPRRPGWRRHLAAGVLLLTLVALTTAMAKPAATTKVPRERATVMLALDVSLSMQASDVRPTRIQAAKTAAKAFVRQLPATFNLGLVSFAGTATVAVSPTKDHGSVERAIDNLSLGEATATGEAVFAALDAIKAVPADGAKGPPPARIVLLSDGFRTVGRGNDVAAQAAVEARVPISTIAFGTDTGTVSLQGQEVPVPVDRSALRQLADNTSGKYYEAASASKLRAVYQDLGSSIGFRTVPRDVTRWFVGIALLLGISAAGMSLLWTSRLP